jgi:hypothetical protein
MTNNGDRSPDCGDIGIRSECEEMSLIRLKYTKKCEIYLCNLRWWWFRIKRQRGHVMNQRPEMVMDLGLM